MFDLLFDFSRLFKCRYCHWQRGDWRRDLFLTQHYFDSLHDSMDTCNYIRYLAQFETISVRTVNSTQEINELEKKKTIRSKLKNWFKFSNRFTFRWRLTFINVSIFQISLQESRKLREDKRLCLYALFVCSTPFVLLVIICSTKSSEHGTFIDVFIMHAWAERDNIRSFLFLFFQHSSYQHILRLFDDHIHCKCDSFPSNHLEYCSHQSRTNDSQRKYSTFG